MEIANPNPIRSRSMVTQFFLMIFTCGVYAIYWYYSTADEMTKALKRPEAVTLWTVLLFVPPLSLYSYYKHAEMFELLTDEYINRWIIMLLWIFFAPGVWFVVQRKLNEMAELKSTEQVP